MIESETFTSSLSSSLIPPSYTTNNLPLVAFTPRPSCRRYAPPPLSYDIAVRAFKPESSTNDFILDEDMSLGQKDFLQVRVLVDGIPFRQSSSYAQPSTSLEAATRSLRGTFVVQLGGEAWRGAKRRVSDVRVGNESRTGSYFCTRNASFVITAIILTPHPNTFRDSLQLDHTQYSYSGRKGARS